MKKRTSKAEAPDVILSFYFLSCKLLHITAVVPAVGAEFAFWQPYGSHKVIQSLEFECGKLQMFAHCLHHLMVFCIVGIHILLQNLIRKVLSTLKVPYYPSGVQVK